MPKRHDKDDWTYASIAPARRVAELNLDLLQPDLMARAAERLSAPTRRVSMEALLRPIRSNSRRTEQGLDHPTEKGYALVRRDERGCDIRFPPRRGTPRRGEGPDASATATFDGPVAYAARCSVTTPGSGTVR